MVGDLVAFCIPLGDQRVVGVGEGLTNNVGSGEISVKSRAALFSSLQTNEALVVLLGTYREVGHLSRSKDAIGSQSALTLQFGAQASWG